MKKIYAIKSTDEQDNESISGMFYTSKEFAEKVMNNMVEQYKTAWRNIKFEIVEYKLDAYEL